MAKELQTLIDWLVIKDTPQNADLIIAFGSYSLQTPIKAAELYKQGLAPKILVTGKIGSTLEKDWKLPLAIIFKQKLLELGIPEIDILTQVDSTNTLEDVLFSQQLIDSLVNSTNRIIIISRPLQQLRTFLTIQKHLPRYKYINQPADFDTELDTPDHLKIQAWGEIEKIRKYGAQGDITQITPPDFIK